MILLKFGQVDKSESIFFSKIILLSTGPILFIIRNVLSSSFIISMILSYK